MTTANTAQLNNEKAMTVRPPIVVVLGHVDHGKSSLLEAIREDFRITQKESGGITQHIGAYEAEYQSKKITFLDTPGHELFSAMRARGANVADIAVLVVAADEGVKPQTVEAIQQIKKAGIPEVVAIHKIDRPGANVQRVKQELAQHGMVVESYGGNVPAVETSATTKQGITELLEMILLVAELEGLNINEHAPGEGVVIESSMDAKRGATATILVQKGKVRKGDSIGTATTTGKVRILEDFQGNQREQVLPSMPAIVLGFLKPPRIGEEFHVFEQEEAMADFLQKGKLQQQAQVVALDSDARVVNMLLKADVEGSLEALQEVLKRLSGEEVSLRVIATGVGEILETDVKLAQSARAPIFGFRTKVSNAAAALAQREGVSIQTFDIIYELVQAVRELLEKTTHQQEEGIPLGSLLVLAVFATDGNKQIIGGKMLEGEVRKGTKAGIVREGRLVGEGRVENVQHDKKNVTSVGAGKECGLSVESDENIHVGDQLNFFPT